MRSGDEGAAPAIRLWWALPFALVVVTAVVFVAVVLPALASGTGVPAQLVVHRSASPTRPPTTPTPSRTASPHPTHTSTSPAPVPTRSTTVVPPEQPVVRESDDRHEDHGNDR